jgi:sporulation protein YlmC with PRC-barrel domain
MKTLSLLIATTSLVVGLGLAAPVLSETVKKVMLTQVDPSMLTTAWRASDIIGAQVHDDRGTPIGRVKDMLVTASGSVPFVIVTNMPGPDSLPRDVVVSASDFELVDGKLTMHGGSPEVLLSLPIH